MNGHLPLVWLIVEKPVLSGLFLSCGPAPIESKAGATLGTIHFYGGQMMLG